MKQALKRAADAAAAPKDAIARRAPGGPSRSRRARAEAQERVLVVPSHAPGSLGDEALVEGVLGEIARRGWTATVVEYDDRRTWGAAKGIESVDMSAFFHLSRRVAPLAWRSLPAFRRTLAQTARVVLIGADVIDGHYNGARTV
jgi:hypothetical protein